MKLFVAWTIAVFWSLSSWASTAESQKLIELGKLYKSFMFRNEATKQELKAAVANTPDSLKQTAEFIAEAIRSDNQILSKTFLIRPDDRTLKQIYIVRTVFVNTGKENGIDNEKLVDSLTARDIPVYQLVDNYYSMLLNSELNKNQSENIAKFNFKVKDYQLKDATEEGILALQVAYFCNRQIWGFMNIVKPPNTSKAFSHIRKFPELSGRPYFQYTDLHFPDFEKVFDTEKGIESYKSYYIDKLYELLLMHFICLKKEGRREKETYDLLLGSIMKEQSLYRYTKYKDVLEEIFKEQKQ